MNYKLLLTTLSVSFAFATATYACDQQQGQSPKSKIDWVQAERMIDQAVEDAARARN